MAGCHAASHLTLLVRPQGVIELRHGAGFLLRRWCSLLADLVNSLANGVSRRVPPDSSTEGQVYKMSGLGIKGNSVSRRILGFFPMKSPKALSFNFPLAARAIW